MIAAEAATVAPPAAAPAADLLAGSALAPEPFTILAVDDEPNILNALRRLLRSRGYRVHTAPGGAEGLEVLARESIDLVISDMRMPEMNGAEFLDRARERWPETVRILLTGYADIGSTVDAINRGEIFRYIAKPWDEPHLLGVISQGLERKALERERRRLEALTRAQNAELAELNRTLEARVEARTAELREAHLRLRAGFLNSVRVFSSIIELRAGAMAGHSRRVADWVRQMTQQLAVPAEAAQEMLFAALLHDIGKIGLADRMLSRPLSQYSSDERQEYLKHPARGEALLMALEPLAGAARIIRAHHERFDGSGYPDGLRGLEIPLGARLLAVAEDYDELLQGHVQEKPVGVGAARQLIAQGRGRRYDPQAADAFLALLGPEEAPRKPRELELRTEQLAAGMVLSRDLLSRDGLLLLARDHILDEALIRQLRGYESAENARLGVFVRP